MKCGTETSLLDYLVESGVLDEIAERNYPWTVVYDPGDLKPGEQLTVVGRFETMEAATYFLTYGPTDKEALEAGRYGIDGPGEGLLMVLAKDY